MNPLAEEFHQQVTRYDNTAAHNDRVFAEFTAATRADLLLAGHRQYIEENKLGFGDPAFHAMWQSLLAAAEDRFGNVDALEIGVFKGQVVSLWALLAKTHGWPLRIHAITPFKGQPLPRFRWWRVVLAQLSRRFHERLRSGDFYSADDYEQAVRRVFDRFGLDFDGVRWIRGYSDAPEVLAIVQEDRFHVIYVDGSHTFDAASADIANYGPKVIPGGWLVMDDAAFDLPGTSFWKGYESVARASRHLPDLGFHNVLNVGHNRIFEKSR